MEAGPNPSGLCLCGCGQTTPKSQRTDPTRGVIRGQHAKYAKGHRSIRWDAPKLPYVEDPATGCHVFTGARGSAGYGGAWYRGRVMGAHRVAWMHHHGVVLSPDQQLDHLCRNRACINVAHLEVVTSTENTRRGSKTKLSAIEAAEIRELCGQGWRKQEIGVAYGVTDRHVSSIAAGVRWKGVAA